MRALAVFVGLPGLLPGLLVAAACSTLACSATSSSPGAGAGQAEGAAAPAAPATAEAREPAREVSDDPDALDDADASQGRPMRVLVTGFNDWKELGEPPNSWRCRDNPSCRLLLGEASAAEPTAHAGPLVTRLQAAAPEVEWSFATMPVTWEAFAEVPADVDVIVNIGLGVYDRFDVLQLEAGAYNRREGTDAAGVERHELIASAAPEVLAAPEASPIPGRLAALAGQRFAGYELIVAEARPDNSYLCNETHYHALQALHAGAGQLRAVYFLHIPHAEDDDYEALAEGVAAVVLRLARG